MPRRDLDRGCEQDHHDTVSQWENTLQNHRGKGMLFFLFLPSSPPTLSFLSFPSFILF